MINTELKTYVAECQTQQAQLSGADLPWLQQLRAAGLAEFTAQGFPTTRDEAWKYTRTTAIAQKHFPRNSAISNIARKKILQNLPPDISNGFRCVLIDGYFSADLSHLPQQPGIVFSDLATALTMALPHLTQQLGQLTKTAGTPFTALNTAWLEQGTYIEILANTQLVDPIHILHISTLPGQAHYLRHFIQVGAGAKVHLLQHYISLTDQSYFSNSVTEIFLAEGAYLNYMQLQQQGERALHIDKVYVQQAAHSTFKSHQYSMGSLLARADIHTYLIAADAYCELRGLYLTAQQQHIDHHTEINHQVANTTSREYYKGILLDKSRAVFNGKVIVAADAQQTDAQQKNANLLLSREAEIDTKPELEIYANDVKCSHGATVGQLDETALFYLKARGINEPLARSLLLYAFAQEMLSSLELSSIQQLVNTCLLQSLPDKAVMADILALTQ